MIKRKKKQRQLPKRQRLLLRPNNREKPRELNFVPKA